MTKYESYQLQWMIEHGYSLHNLIGCLGDVANEELAQDGCYQNAIIVDEAFSIFEKEIGFPGHEIWVSEEEFHSQEENEGNY